ncbi:MAG: YgjV family protein [Clostridia bacterium]|nr:YgjV family protein [Clostridia bacterium]MBR6741873.1 YgjV family protein [Clostridia bacterium]
MEELAQAVGIVAMAFNILSYQFKKRESVIICHLFGSTLFAISFFMLGAYTGGILNAVDTVRGLVFYDKKKLKADSPVWIAVFIIIYVLSYIATFTLFSKEFTLFNAVIELLPVIGLTAMTVGYSKDNSKAIRLSGLISSPSWLIYNVANVAIGAIICEILSLISIALGIIRHDIKRK